MGSWGDFLRVAGRGDSLHVFIMSWSVVVCSLNVALRLFAPHVAWTTDEAIEGLADQLIDNIDALGPETQETKCSSKWCKAASQARIFYLPNS